MKEFKIFLIEDDVWFSEMMKYHLSLNPDFEVSDTEKYFKRVVLAK